MRPTVQATIVEDSWVPVKYRQAIWDDQLRAWISEAEVAETGYTAFARWKTRPSPPGWSSAAFAAATPVPRPGKAGCSPSTAASGPRTKRPVWRKHERLGHLALPGRIGRGRGGSAAEPVPGAGGQLLGGGGGTSGADLICSNGTAKTSCRTKVSRSAGDSVSRRRAARSAPARAWRPISPGRERSA
jgi:hypothetical protein